MQANRPNPLLTPSPLPYGAPVFQDISDADYLPAFQEAIARARCDEHYGKWLLIEHDTHLRPPEIDLKKSADILKALFA